MAKKTDETIELAKRVAPLVGCSVTSALTWIRTGTAPHNRLVAAAWQKAIAKARRDLAK